jgi:hypothetical protein
VELARNHPAGPSVGVMRAIMYHYASQMYTCSNRSIHFRKQVECMYTFNLLCILNVQAELFTKKNVSIMYT